MCGMAQAMDVQSVEGTGKGAQTVSGCVSWHWFHEKCGGECWCPQNCYHPFNMAWDFGRRYLPFFGEGFLATILLVRRNTPEPSAAPSVLPPPTVLYRAQGFCLAGLFSGILAAMLFGFATSMVEPPTAVTTWADTCS